MNELNTDYDDDAGDEWGDSSDWEATASVASPGEVVLPPAPARSGAVRRLEEQLLEVYPADVARLVARSVVDPQATRSELRTPSRVRVAGGGTLEVIRVDLWAHAVVPYPSNPRESGHHRLPIQDNGAYALSDPEPLSQSSSVMVIEAASREDVGASQNDSAAFLIDANSYVEEIAAEGVMVPTMVVPLRIRHADGTPDVAILATADGSSRVASCHRLLEIKTSDATYVYSQDPRRLLGLVGDVSQASRKVLAGIESVPPPTRALTVPAQLVVRSEGADIRRCIQGYMGMQHVSHPAEWGSAGEIEAKADAALLEMRDAGVPAHIIAWFAGTMRVVDAEARGLRSLLDQRLVDVVAVVRDNRDPAVRGIKRVDSKVQRARDTKLAEVCADLALRPARATFGRSTEGQVARQSLQEILKLSFKAPWRSTGRDPDVLRDAALLELGSKKKPTGFELALLASYWMITKGILRPLYYNQRLPDGSADRRGAHLILYPMLESERGIRQLHRVVVDGRNGHAPQLVAADPGGDPHTQGAGTTLTNESLRLHVVPNPEKVDPRDAVIPPAGATPASILSELQAAYAKTVRTVRNGVDDLEKLVERGVPLVEEVGWPQDSAADLLADLDRIRIRVQHWQWISEFNRERTRRSSDPVELDQSSAATSMAPLAEPQ